MEWPVADEKKYCLQSLPGKRTLSLIRRCCGKISSALRVRGKANKQTDGLKGMAGGMICAMLFAQMGISQCTTLTAAIAETERCLVRNHAPAQKSEIDASRTYRLEELIDLAEEHNPRTHIAWESAKQSADRLGMARSEYYPHLAALALAGTEREIEPWPRALGATKGYFVADASVVQEGVQLQYTVFDFGRREQKAAAAKAMELAATAVFQRTVQDVAFRVVTSYYNLITAEERLEASRQIDKTAQTTQSAAEAQLENGRTTLPDVLNARAAAAQASYDLEASIGGVDAARVLLRETIGADPSDEIEVEKPEGVPLPAGVVETTAELVAQASRLRPDLQAVMEKLKAASFAAKGAKAEYLPEIQFKGMVAEQSLSPSLNVPGPNPLGHGSEGVWNAGVSVQWNLFDGGLRRSAARAADSLRRETEDEKQEKEDAIGREVWLAYVQYRTSLHQHAAAEKLLTSASTSYDASLDAYRYGVKNLVDLVTAENQLAQARLALVQSRSTVRTNAVSLDFATGNLLRKTKAPVQSAEQKP